VVQALPVIGAVRQRFPRADISWVIRNDLRDLVDGHPDLSECIPFTRCGGPAAFLRLLRALRSRRFDLVIDLQGLARTACMALATGAPVRMGLTSAREGAALASNVVVPDSGRDVPASDRYWRVAECLGVGASGRRAHISVPPADQAWARSMLDALPRPVVAVHAGALWETKRCPPQLFAGILARTLAGCDASVILVGSESDAPHATAILELLNSPRTSRPTCADLTGLTSLKQLAALLSDVDVLLCNDSGPMHLAAAFATPVVGLFTCTSPTLSGPQGPRDQLFVAEVPCASRYHKTCPLRGRRHLGCHRALPVDTISQSLLQILRRAQHGPETDSDSECLAMGAAS
jgi:ADP-heptose:LPS heptosyltransferase